MSHPTIRTARQDRNAQLLGAACLAFIAAAVVAMVLGALAGGAW